MCAEAGPQGRPCGAKGEGRDAGGRSLSSADTDSQPHSAPALCRAWLENTARDTARFHAAGVLGEPERPAVAHRPRRRLLGAAPDRAAAQRPSGARGPWAPDRWQQVAVGEAWMVRGWPPSSLVSTEEHQDSRGQRPPWGRQPQSQLAQQRFLRPPGLHVPAARGRHRQEGWAQTPDTAAQAERAPSPLHPPTLSRRSRAGSQHAAPPPGSQAARLRLSQRAPSRTPATGLRRGQAPALQGVRAQPHT